MFQEMGAPRQGRTYASKNRHRRVRGSGRRGGTTRRRRLPESARNPGQPTPVGSFNVTELGDKADKVGKDDNFRGLALFNNVLYYTKGSGGNGVDTVYFLDTTGTACPDGVGVPAANAPLPTTSIASTLTSAGLASNMCVLKGFPTVLAKSATDASDYPFGLWFANPTTLYLADEGAGDNAYANGSYTAAAASTTTAGLQKWVYNATAGEWQLAYTLQNGLDLGTPYSVRGYPTGTNSVTSLPWAPATRRPAEHHRQGQPERHRLDLGGHLDRQRRRRPGRGPEPAGLGHRQARRDLAAVR